MLCNFWWLMNTSFARSHMRFKHGKKLEHIVAKQFETRSRFVPLSPVVPCSIEVSETEEKEERVFPEELTGNSRMSERRRERESGGQKPLSPPLLAKSRGPPFPPWVRAQRGLLLLCRFPFPFAGRNDTCCSIRQFSVTKGL